MPPGVTTCWRRKGSLQGSPAPPAPVQSGLGDPALFNALLAVCAQRPQLLGLLPPLSFLWTVAVILTPTPRSLVASFRLFSFGQIQCFISGNLSLPLCFLHVTPFYIFWGQSHRATFLPGHPPVSGSLHVKEQGLGSGPCRDSSGHLEPAVLVYCDILNAVLSARCK